MHYVYWQQLTVCPLMQEPTPGTAAAPEGISPEVKRARTSKEDEALLIPLASFTSSQQRLPESLLLCSLADANKDCVVQVLQIGGFMKYLVLSIVLHAQAPSCMVDWNMCTHVFESTLANLHELSTGHVNVLAVDMHLFQNYQAVHTVCYCGELNI